MAYDPNKHHRRSIRHSDHDYTTPGAYFVTMCTKWRECVLEDAALAAICMDVWRALPRWFPTIALDEFVVMPNHVHFIVWLGVGAGLAPAHPDALASSGDRESRPYGDGQTIPWNWEMPTPQSQRLNPALGDVIGSWKSLVANTYLSWIKKHDLNRRAKFWQRNYYDRIVRDDRALVAIRRYIRENPIRWAIDPDNPNDTLGLPFPESVDDYFEDIKRHDY